MDEGAVTFCQSEERLNRIKNSSGFPVQTLDYVYRNIAAPDTIDVAVIFENTIVPYASAKARAFQPVQASVYAASPDGFVAKMKDVVRRTELGSRLQRYRMTRADRSPGMRREAEAYFAQALKLPVDRVRYMDHHLAHAWSVVPNIQAWGQTLVFTLDGDGDDLCATVNQFDGGSMSRLDATGDRHSLGRYYLETAQILGMKALEDEFKVMGLAPYARPRQRENLLEELRRLLTVDDLGRWHSVPNPERRFAELERLYRFQRFDNIAGAIQSLTEELILKWVRYWIGKIGCRNVAVSGGVFMNVKASQALAALPEVDRLFVMPSAGDESCAIGSAVWGTMTSAPAVKIRPLGDLYLGLAFSDKDVDRALAESDAPARYQITRPAEMHREVAQLLAANKIVARCSGRMEFGARALGNRSILANAGDLLNARRINDAIKSRDFWMPFGPSILEEDLPRYVRDLKAAASAPYMCMAFDSTAEAQRDIPAAIHPRDLTLRPQAVSKGWNPEYHAILQAFKDLTGVGAVLNTSFNLHGEPVVCSATDAIRALDQSGLEYLILGSYLLKKGDGSSLR
jgi:carbamoyltransferase